MLSNRITKVKISGIDGDEYYREIPVYDLPDGTDTIVKGYAEQVWKMYKVHCLPCPYRVSKRSEQFGRK